MKPYDPSTNHVIEDDFEAAFLIAQQGKDAGTGILDKLTPPLGCNQAHHPYETEHHYCMASFHCGHERDEDNGYAVAMFSKSLFSEQEAMNAFAVAIQETTDGRIYVTQL